VKPRKSRPFNSILVPLDGSPPNMSLTADFWLRGPVEGVPPLLMPLAHALLQSRKDLRAAAEPLSPVDLWERPGGAASVGFHLRHICGSVDRLFTYARGQPVRDEQLTALRREKPLLSSGCSSRSRTCSTPHRAGHHDQQDHPGPGASSRPDLNPPGIANVQRSIPADRRARGLRMNGGPESHLERAPVDSSIEGGRQNG
jgi:hypothetical protein